MTKADGPNSWWIRNSLKTRLNEQVTPSAFNKHDRVKDEVVDEDDKYDDDDGDDSGDDDGDGDDDNNDDDT